MKKAVLFDLDGTLWSSVKTCTLAWNDIFKEKLKRELKESDMAGIMGMTVEQIAQTLCPELSPQDGLDIVMQADRHEQPILARLGGELYDGVEECLKRVHEKYFTAIISNCQDGYIQTFLKFYGFEKYFDDIQFCDFKGCTKQHNIQRVIKRNGLEKCVYIGDTQNDCISSRAVGVPFVFASYGFGNVKVFDERADSPSEIFECAEKILESDKVYTERTIVRPVLPKDEEDMLKILCDKSLYIHDVAKPLEKDEAKAEFKRLVEDDFSYSVERRSDGRVIGKIYFCDESNPELGAMSELGYVFAADCQGQGYAFEAADAFCKYQTRLTGRKNVIAFVSEKNKRSIKLLNKLGFSYLKNVNDFKCYLNVFKCYLNVYK